MANRTPATDVGVGRAGRLAALSALISVRRPDVRGRGNLFLPLLVLRLAGVGLLAWIGYIHWYLWHLGYKEIPTDGPFFLIDGIAGVLLAVVLLAVPRPLAGLLSAAFVASTILALVVSLSVGLFGFKESIHASYVVEALVLESIAVLILAAWTVIAAGAVARRR